MQPASIQKATVAFFKPTGHGLTMHIEGKCPSFSSKVLKVNIFGNVWEAVPGPVASIIKFSFLPLELGPDYSNFPASFAAGEGKQKLELKVGTKENGTQGVLHATISTQLQAQINAGDHKFLLEFTNENDQVVFGIVTKPSLIQLGLESPGHNINLREKFEKPKASFDTLWILLLLALFGAIFFLYIPKQSDLAAVHLNSLTLQLIKKNQSYGAIAVGYNSCLDLIVGAVELMNRLGIKKRPEQQCSLHNQIYTSNELSETFEHAFKAGIAIERFIENRTLCNQMIQAARRLASRKTSIGGNAALMAAAFAELGGNVLLGGAVGQDLSDLLGTRLGGLSDHMAFLPVGNQSADDEVHLIMEYKKGESWGGHVATRANRFIVHCDNTTSRVGVLEDFHDSIAKGTDLVVLAGLHMLEREENSFRTQRLKEVTERLTQLLTKIPVHLELASVAEIGFLKELSTTVVPFVNSIGLNEQELGDLVAALKDESREKHAAQFKPPTVSAVVDALLHVFRSFPKSGERELGRIHFHALEFHIVAVKTGSGWTKGTVSVSSGSLASSLHACQVTSSWLWPGKFSLYFNSESWGTATPVEETNGIFEWEQEGVIFSLAPVAVCKNPRKTVGLGDMISASGLIHHTAELQ